MGNIGQLNLGPVNSGLLKEDALRKSLGLGAQIALENCQNVFQWDRWNCPESAFLKKNRQPANRETAFVRAIIAAGIMHTVAKNCSNGGFGPCGKCQMNPEDSSNQITANKIYKYLYTNPYTENLTHTASNYRIETLKNGDESSDILWRWAECHNKHIAFGEEIAIKYLDDLDVNGVDLQSYLYLHNNAAGRLAVRATMKKRCRCHGVSGSCTIQTCWNELAPFSEVAEYLREKYDEAVRVDFDNGVDRLIVGNVQRTVQDIPLTDLNNLIYLNDSPDYCVANTTIDWEGTLGRICSKNRSENTTKSERRSCKTLCKSCGYRVRKRIRQRQWRCNCNFQWCCEVTCKTCTETVNEFFCE
ncbi:protein Wnt-8a-like [Chrysoperla carnea]|uniref:protein Wnt-8a-like n=1 Tax=Chrysoperla carnea TaxID=189513 RepID=UPI001D082C67|nr:protein Wnt-8a-like [Chrysoperla carnea]